MTSERRSSESGIERKIRRQVVRQRVIKTGKRRAEFGLGLDLGRDEGSVGSAVYCWTMCLVAERYHSEGVR